MPIETANARRRTVANFRFTLVRLIGMRSPSEPVLVDVLYRRSRETIPPVDCKPVDHDHPKDPWSARLVLTH